MAIYETVFIARQDLTETQVKDLAKKYETIITDHKGKILKTEHWGLRALAYRMNKSRKGHYVLIESDATAEALSETSRLLGLDEDIMRNMTVRLEEATTKESALLTKKEEYNKREAA